MVIKQLKLHQNTRDDKFIVCLNKITKSFPRLADRYIRIMSGIKIVVIMSLIAWYNFLYFLFSVMGRFMNFVFFLIPKLHGVMKTHCLEVVMCRTQETADMYLQLKSKEFTQVMCHR